MPAAAYQLNAFVPVAAPAGARASRRPSLLVRAFRALHDAQRLRAEREIGRMIEARGGKFTDALERDIEGRFY